MVFNGSCRDCLSDLFVFDGTKWYSSYAFVGIRKDSLGFDGIGWYLMVSDGIHRDS